MFLTQEKWFFHDYGVQMWTGMQGRSVVIHCDSTLSGVLVAVGFFQGGLS